MYTYIFINIYIYTYIYICKVTRLSAVEPIRNLMLVPLLLATGGRVEGGWADLTHLGLGQVKSPRPWPI